MIKIPLSANGHFSRINMLLSRNLRELHVYLSRGQCWATTPLMKICSPPAKLRQRITDHFLLAFFKHAASITESLLRTDCCWLVFWQGLLTHPLQHALWLSPAPSQNFRRTFARISLFTDPGALKEKRTPGALVFGSGKASLLKAWLLRFLRLQKSSLGSDSGRCKDALQDHGVWLSRSLTFGSSAAIPMKGKVIAQKPHHAGNWTRTKPKFSGALLLPDPRRQWVAALYI